MMRCWKILDEKMRPTVSGVNYRYPTGRRTKHLDPARLGLCEFGYHYCEGKDILGWLREGWLCEVEPCEKHEPLRGDGKSVSCSLRIVKRFRLDARILRLFACDCAERALLRERERGREPHADSWRAVEVARRYAAGEATDKELRGAYSAAVYAADAARAASAAWAAAASAASAASAAYDASAASAAYDAVAAVVGGERTWQYERLLHYTEAGQP